VNASQIMILSRTVGLNAAATFAIGTKLFTVCQQLTGRIIESSAPSLTEMFVRGDTARFNLRFSNIVSITAFLATIGAAGLVAGNTAIVSLWTSAAIHWNLTCDALLSGLLIATSLTRCLIGVFGLTGSFRPVRYIYFVEGCIFIAVAIPAATYFGIAGILGASLIVHVAVTGILAFLKAEKALGSIKQLICPLVASTTIAGFAFMISLVFANAGVGPHSMILLGGAVVSLSTISGWFWVLSFSLRADCLTKLSSLLGRPQSL
jgi:O-antigen/teichoic acid export membrane protein